LNTDILQILPYSPDVICFTETKIKHSPLISINIPGYEPLINADSTTNAGGVGVFAGGVGVLISNQFQILEISKNEFVSSNRENLWIQLSTPNNQKFILGIIYRHPKGDMNAFLTLLDKKLNLLKNSSYYYILGDINLNITSSNGSSIHCNNYRNILASNGAITNDIKNKIYPCIFLSDVTDHYPIACTITGVKRQHNQKLMPVQYRDMKNFDLNNFNTDL